MFHLFRFIQKIDAAVTPTFNSLITVGDTVLAVFQKLQGLLTVRNIRSAITTQYTGGASSVADQTINTLTIPANTLQVGNTLATVMRGLMTKPNSAGTSINFWIKINGTKVCTATYVPGAAITALPFVFNADTVVRTVGSGGNVFITGSAVVWSTATTGNNVTATSTSVAVDTTAAVTITVGYNFSNSNASNNITSNIANLIME